MSAEPLTKRQAEVLAFIEYHWVAHCRPPTMRGIATNSVADVVAALTRKGELVPRELGEDRKWGCILPYSVKAWLSRMPRTAP